MNAIPTIAITTIATLPEELYDVLDEESLIYEKKI